MASVVASFDSTTTIGAVARIRAAQSPTRSPSIRRPQAQDEQAGAGPRPAPRPAGPRTGCPPQRRPGHHQPVDQDGLVIAGLGVERGAEPVAAGAHLARAAGVARLVAVPEADPPFPARFSVRARSPTRTASRTRRRGESGESFRSGARGCVVATVPSEGEVLIVAPSDFASFHGASSRDGLARFRSRRAGEHIRNGWGR